MHPCSARPRVSPSFLPAARRLLCLWIALVTPVLGMRAHVAFQRKEVDSQSLSCLHSVHAPCMCLPVCHYGGLVQQALGPACRPGRGRGRERGRGASPRDGKEPAATGSASQPRPRCFNEACSGIFLPCACTSSTKRSFLPSEAPLWRCLNESGASRQASKQTSKHVFYNGLVGLLCCCWGR